MEKVKLNNAMNSMFVDDKKNNEKIMACYRCLVETFYFNNRIANNSEFYVEICDRLNYVFIDLSDKID